MRRHHHTLGSIVLALSLASLLGILVTTSGASAQSGEPAAEARQRFDIPAGPLSRALNRLATQAGLALTYDPAQTAGKTTDALRGEFSPGEGLQRLLAGTGLQYRFTSADTVTLANADAQKGDGPIQLGPITVTGEGGEGYSPVTGTNTTVLPGESLSNKETPFSIHVVDENVTEERAMKHADEIGSLLPGFHTSFGAQRRLQFTSRGFSSSQDLSFKRNGLPMSNGSRFFLDHIGQIEVLKGPTSALEGRAEPGGLLNFVTKKPLDRPLREITLEGNSQKRFKVGADLNIPLDTAPVRVVAFYDRDPGRVEDADQLLNESGLVYLAGKWEPEGYCQVWCMD